MLCSLEPKNTCTALILLCARVYKVHIHPAAMPGMQYGLIAHV